MAVSGSRKAAWPECSDGGWRLGPAAGGRVKGQCSQEEGSVGFRDGRGWVLLALHGRSPPWVALWVCMRGGGGWQVTVL